MRKGRTSIPPPYSYRRASAGSILAAEPTDRAWPERDSNRDGGDDNSVDPPRREGQVVDRIDLGGEMDEAVVAARPGEN